VEPAGRGGLLVSAVCVIANRLTTITSAAPTQMHFCQKVKTITPFRARFPAGQGLSDRQPGLPATVAPWRAKTGLIGERGDRQVYSRTDRCYNLAELSKELRCAEPFFCQP
jgi:hypothetical protein